MSSVLNATFAIGSQEDYLLTTLPVGDLSGKACGFLTNKSCTFSSLSEIQEFSKIFEHQRSSCQGKLIVFIFLGHFCVGTSLNVECLKSKTTLEFS